MTLDIIIPHYHEPWSLCKPLFDSIALQCGVNWENIGVIVVNDGVEGTLADYLFAGYPYHIKHIVQIHSGLSATRNRGLDESKADYVMFCDSDDQFLNSLAPSGEEHRSMTSTSDVPSAHDAGAKISRLRKVNLSSHTKLPSSMREIEQRWLMPVLWFCSR